MQARNYHTADTKMSIVYTSGQTYDFAVHNTHLLPTMINAKLYDRNVAKVVITYNDRTFECVRKVGGGYTRTEV